MILPKLDYCDFVWNNLAPSRYNALERLQTRAARIILKESSLSHEHLLRQLSWMSLKARSNMHIVTFVFKCVYNNAPDQYNLNIYIYIYIYIYTYIYTRLQKRCSIHLYKYTNT